MPNDDLGDNEREWAAAKREFVADSRDDIAAARDRAADARDALAAAVEARADERESELEEWSASLAEWAVALGLVAEGANSAGQRDAERRERARAGADRVSAASDRDAQSALREEASQQRLSRPTLLARTFADIAEHLQSAGNVEDVLTRIAEAAVATIAGGEYGSVTLREEDNYRSAGATSPVATDVDREQYRVNQGPSLDAISVPLVDAPEFPDGRWPALGGLPVEHGVRSSACYQLRGAGPGGSEAGLGSLNLYASRTAAFDSSALEIGSILAAHASLAARAAGQRATIEGFSHDLDRALHSRDVIGQAKGILMERLKVSPEDAFEILRRVSQQLNVKLREVAQRIADTGEVRTR